MPDKTNQTNQTNRTNQNQSLEKSVIVGVFDPEKPGYVIDGILEEMKLLTESAGGEVLETFYQKRRPPDGRYYIGKGKVEEIKNYACAKDVNLIVFYNRLSNTQQRNLEQFFKIKVIDRTRLILDVFATRAQSLEGKMQVELAQLLYLMPRLTGKGIELSRLGGGIGTRGPGETKLEADRRTIKKRISIIRKKLEKLIESRDIQRKNRKVNPIPVVSLVGYTSAGKSTLFKAITGEDVAISRMLFSTLDPLMRRVEMNEIQEGYAFLLSDTVGFIREMPKELFQAFKATLEEMIRADVILHVIDISDPDYICRKEDVQRVLAEMEIPESKVIPLYNKVDLLPDYKELMRKQDKNEDEDKDAGKNNNESEEEVADPGKEDNRIYISAKESQGLSHIKKAIFGNYFKDYERHTLAVPQDIIGLDSIKRWAVVVNTHFQEGLLHVDILCSKENMVKFKEKYGGYVK
jgi:GTPase